MAISATLTPAPNKSIEVIRAVTGNTPGLLAMVDLRVGGVIIRDIRVNNRGRGTHINYPSRKIDGHWIEIVTIASPSLREACESVIMAAALEVIG